MTDARKKPQPRKRPRPGSGKDVGPSGASRGSRPPSQKPRKKAPSKKSATARRKPPVRTGAKKAPSRSKAKPVRKPTSPRSKGRVRKDKPQRPKWWRITRVILVILALLIALLAMTGALVYASMSRDLPDLDEPLKGHEQTSRILDRDGQLITEVFADFNRTRVPLASMPVDLRNAVVAVEDERFYEHTGVDPLGILRALAYDIRTMSTAQGGSTITQQYVVNAFVDREDTLTRKVKEAILAYRLEKDYSKDEILEMYLNMIYFGHGAYSAQTASQVYFGKDVGDLDLAECAMLAGVIRSPGRYSPYLDPEQAQARRTWTLTKMLEQEYITQEAFDQADSAELILPGLEQEATAAPYFVEYVKLLIAGDFGEDALYRGGITVETTLDMAMQSAAEVAIASSLDQEGDPSAALVALEPTTGEIRAMVGGKDFSTQQFNVASQGRRQPGSSFKPFVLVTALENGIPSEKTYECGPAVIPINGSADWTVTGAYGGRTGPMRLREATQKSVNSVFAQVIMEVGADRVVETAHRMGITSDIMPVPAIALGGLDEGVSPLEMASAYGTLAAGGLKAESRAVTRVTDASGEVLFEAVPTVEEILDPAVAYLATDMLKGVISGGTGRAASIGRPAAGKTGTTQAYRDAWFAGYTPDLVAAVWVGHTEGQIEMRDVHGRKVTGGSFPAEIWAEFMKAALADVPATDFPKPSGLTSLQICMESGQQATEYCVDLGVGLFLQDGKPEDCEIHAGPVYVDLPNMIGMTKEEAVATLNGLLLGFEVDEQWSTVVPAGIVAGQSPAGGSQVSTDTVIGLVVSTGEEPRVPPRAAFSYTPENPSVGDPVTFDASASTDDDGVIVKWLWELSGLGTVEGEAVEWTFEMAGEYEVTLWVTDEQGEAGSRTRIIEVK